MMCFDAIWQAAELIMETISRDEVDFLRIWTAGAVTPSTRLRDKIADD